jgi:hypothetical protein
VQHKASELQDEMEHLMTQQSAQMGRLFAAVKDKNEVSQHHHHGHYFYHHHYHHHHHHHFHYH